MLLDSKIKKKKCYHKERIEAHINRDHLKIPIVKKFSFELCSSGSSKIKVTYSTYGFCSFKQEVVQLLRMWLKLCDTKFVKKKEINKEYTEMCWHLFALIAQMHLNNQQFCIGIDCLAL